MRVLFVNPGGDASGGAERSLALLMKGLAALGHELGFVTLSAGTAAERLSSMGATCLADGLHHRLDTARRHGTALGFLTGAMRAAKPAYEAAGEIRRLAQQFRADIIHTNGLRAHVLTPLLSRDHPVVWSLRERPPGAPARFAIRGAARTAAAITAPSEFAAQLASRCRRPVYVIPNPVQSAHGIGADASALRATLGIAPQRPVAAMPAHLHPTKGQHIALSAWSQMPPPRPMLILAGGDLYGEDSRHYRQELRESITALRLEDDVLLPGIIDDIGSLYDIADVAIQPALHPEGFGRSTAEAQAAGVPVIATNIGATPELVEDGRSGILISPRNPAALAQSVRRVLNDATLRAALRRGGLEKSSAYAVDRHARTMQSVYRMVSG